MNALQEKFDENRRRLLMDRSVPGRIGTTLPPLDVPEQELPPNEMLREELDFPEVTEAELVRYFSQLSQFNFSIDHNFYPLGSCTMKYNPKLHDEMASLPGLAEIHPRQPESTVQGALKLMYQLQTCLTESDIYVTYHQTTKAIDTLEAGLAKLPGNAKLNELLLPLYEQSQLYQKAADC